MSEPQYIVTSTTHRNPKAPRAVCKGFYGENPDRFWCDPASPDAKTWPDLESAQRFTRTTGDSSWGWTVHPRITVDRTRIYPRPARRGGAWYWSYDCTGPDGRRFDNRSIAELRRVLKKAYPDVIVVEPWKARRS